MNLALSSEQRLLFELVGALALFGVPPGSMGDRIDEWMKHVELAPMRNVNADEFVLDANNSVQQPTCLYISNRRPAQGLYEKAAFQFQKDK